MSILMLDPVVLDAQPGFLIPKHERVELAPAQGVISDTKLLMNERGPGEPLEELPISVEIHDLVHAVDQVGIG